MTKHITGATVAERITSARKLEGISVSHLSEKTGIADKTLRRRLSTPDQFSLAELSAIARVLSVTLEDLLSDDTGRIAVAS